MMPRSQDHCGDEKGGSLWSSLYTGRFGGEQRGQAGSGVERSADEV